MSQSKLLGAKALVASALTVVFFISGVSSVGATVPNELSITGAPATLTLPAGDQVRDTTTMTINTTVETTVKAEFYRNGTLVSRFVDSVAVLGLPNPTRTITVPLSKLPGATAGTYEVVITDLQNPESAPVATALRVGSGRATSVALSSTTPTQLYPFADGQRDAVSTTILVKDETGLPIKASGSMVVSANGSSKSAAVNIGAEPTSRTLNVTGLKLGAGTLKVTMRGSGGGSAVVAPTVSLSLKPTAITGLTLSTGSTQVYPHLDGYRDSVGIKATVTAAGVPFKFPVSGNIQVRYGTKVVKEWTLSELGTRSVSWNGLNGGKVVQGTYTIVATAKGPQGSAITRSSSIYVSAKKITTLTSTVTYKAASVLKTYTDYSFSGLGECTYFDSGAYECDAWGSYYNTVNDIALFSVGNVTVPTAVRNATQFGAPQVRITAKTNYVDPFYIGDEAYAGVWTNVDGASVKLAAGSRTTPWANLGTNQSTVEMGLVLYGYITAEVESFTVSYRYKVLK